MKTRKSPRPEYRNCPECKQARDSRVFNKEGICAMCQMTTVKLPLNPLVKL